MTITSMFTILKNIRRNIISSIVMLIGITLCFTISIFILDYIHYENSFDKFHKNSNEIFRTKVQIYGNGKLEFQAPISGRLLGPLMKEEIPEVKEFVRLHKLYGGTFVEKKDVKFLENSVFFVDSTFFKVFSFPIVAGNPDKMLKNAYTCAISESIKSKYFGKTNPVGNTLFLNNANYIVDGVFKDVPENSHIKFDILLSNSDVLSRDAYKDGWGWMNFYTYVLITPNSNSKIVEAKMRSLVEKHNGDVYKSQQKEFIYSLQKLTDIHYNSNLEMELEKNGNKELVWFWLILVIFIFLLTLINNVNVTISGLTGRFKEIGLRKMLGSKISGLASFLLNEIVFIIFIALILTLILRIFLVPIFQDLLAENGQQVPFSLWYQFGVISLLIGLILLVNWSSIILFLTNIKFNNILHGKSLEGNKRMKLRKVFMTFQIFIMIGLLFSVMTIYRQYKYLINYNNLGYNKENLYIINSKGHETYLINIFKNELLKFPGISAVTTSNGIPGQMYSSTIGLRKHGEQEEKNILIKSENIDNSFFDVYGIKIKSGRNFFEASGNMRNSVIINESASKLLNYKSTEEAIGQMVILSNYSDECVIAGVCIDYHHQNLSQAVEPMIFRYNEVSPGYISIRLQDASNYNLITDVKNTYKNFFPANVLDGFYFNDYYISQYKTESQLSKILLLLTIVITAIACLGIFGISSFIVRSRTRETVIRKISGASYFNMLQQLLRPYLILMIIASLFAIPITTYLINKWLENYSNKVALNWYTFIIPVIITFFIVLITIINDIIRVNSTKPAHYLKQE